MEGGVVSVVTWAWTRLRTRNTEIIATLMLTVESCEVKSGLVSGGQ